MPPLAYLTPFGFLTLVPVGAWLGGPWTFASAAAIPLVLTVLDALLGKDASAAPGPAHPALAWLPRLYIVAQLATTVWVALRIAGGGSSPLEAVGLTVSNGVATGVFGLVAAHEMIHDRGRWDRALGLMLLGSVLYMHFSISHVRGHHRFAGSSADPTTARIGESLYAFLARSIVGQFRNAGRSTSKRMILYLAVEICVLLAVASVSLAALGFLVTNAVLAILLLETFNYVAHYGLSRRVAPDGSVEPLGPQHSWNSANRMNNAALFNMGRHSDHHLHRTRSYDRLQPIEGSPELPSGYAAALLTAFVPPLWRRAMDGRALRARAAIVPSKPRRASALFPPLADFAEGAR
jgi:alkane 1-monooxygenase